ncbi:MAG: glycosyltransferase, partial [Verrucomicrobiota bacterium]
MHIHYVIPAYRESKRLPGFLNQLLPQLQQSPLKLTVQIVDDGSGIDEQDLLSRFIISKQSDFPFLLPPILNPVNQGKGTAVHSGWKSAPECDLIGFVDADGSISPQELLRFTELAIQQPGACHFASRIKMMGRKIQRSELRHYIGRIYATLVGMSLKIPVYDSQCGL